jgi:nucleoside 2-deoxyribosyltransferase
MKFYIAGCNQQTAIALSSELKSLGHEIICTWLTTPFKRTLEHTIEERVAIAKLDADEVTEADAVLLVDSPDMVPGGKFVEAGIAIGQGKPVYVIGRRENMLMWHPLVIQVDSVADLMYKIT